MLEEIKKKYKDVDVVRIVNPVQVLFYLHENIHPLWLEPGYNGKIVFVFEKKATLLLFKKWRDRDTGYIKKEVK